jgi:glycine C-acetyltransferase
MTIPDVAACLEAVNLLEESDTLVTRLWENTELLKARLVEAGVNLGRTQTPILPIIIGDAHVTRAFSQRLFEAGVFVMPIVYPTVPMGTSRVRVMNTAAHSHDDLAHAADTMIEAGRSLGII